MMPRLLSLATFGTTLGCALIAGAFFAFSTFVMKALASLPPAQAVRAMQAINVAAPTGLFLAALVGTAVACAALALQALLGWTQPGAPVRLAGSLAYPALSPSWAGRTACGARPSRDGSPVCARLGVSARPGSRRR